MIISHPVLLRMRSVLDKSCRENQNKHFMFCNSSMKTVPFMGQYGKIWQYMFCNFSMKTVPFMGQYGKI
jgi:hypothetical protein